MWRSVGRMSGEFLREAAVLVAVFAPLDAIVNGHSMTPLYLVNTLAIVGGCLFLGVLMGVKADGQ